MMWTKRLTHQPCGLGPWSLTARKVACEVCRRPNPTEKRAAFLRKGIRSLVTATGSFKVISPTSPVSSHFWSLNTFPGVPRASDSMFPWGPVFCPGGEWPCTWENKCPVYTCVCVCGGIPNPPLPQVIHIHTSSSLLSLGRSPADLTLSLWIPSPSRSRAVLIAC